MSTSIDNTKKGILNSLEDIDNIGSEERDVITNNKDNDSNIAISKKESTNHIQRIFYITPDLDKFINKLKKETGRDKSEIVRIALTYLKEQLNK